MTKRFFAGAGIAVFLLAGCSPRDWQAKLSSFRAEGAMEKAQRLKGQKVPFERRKALYVEACGHFLAAYEANPEVFTYIRIEEAVDCCWKAGEPEKEEVFRQFGEVYAREHPTEYEYGDAGVGAIDMGG